MTTHPQTSPPRDPAADRRFLLAVAGLPLLVVLLAGAVLAAVWSQIPTVVASHWGSHGVNGTQSATGFLAVSTVAILGVSLLIGVEEQGATAERPVLVPVGVRPDCFLRWSRCPTRRSSVDAEELSVSEYRIEALTADTWDAFAHLMERNNGVFGGCWCTWFHTMAADKTRDAEDNRHLKECLVKEGRAHAALVLDGDEAVAWCQFGSPRELPNIYHRKQYEAELDVDPDYRITCLFVDKSHRRRGVSAVALRGAVELIADAGGGTVEGYPHDNHGERKAVLYNGTRALFERAGFSYIKAKGAGNCVMRRDVVAQRREAPARR